MNLCICFQECRVGSDHTIFRKLHGAILLTTVYCLTFGIVHSDAVFKEDLFPYYVNAIGLQIQLMKLGSSRPLEPNRELSPLMF
ncbi:Leucine-Rich Repeat-Containing Protein 72 [Manis pentadactyla]|nr:Leucine-Rich Repeat-Containing Protein 72 [Manis pentadactyla]